MPLDGKACCDARFLVLGPPDRYDVGDDVMSQTVRCAPAVGEVPWTCRRDPHPPAVSWSHLEDPLRFPAFSLL